MAVVIYKILFVLLYILLGLVLLTTTVGLPGNWILVGVALIIGLITGFEDMSWWMLGLCAGVAVVGEVIESISGALFVAKRGGSKWGVIGTIVGGIAGVVLGSSIVPPLGSVVLGFAGAFAGAVLGEYIRNRDMDSALHVGMGSFFGRVTAVAAKLAAGTVILWVIVTTTWP